MNKMMKRGLQLLIGSYVLGAALLGLFHPVGGIALLLIGAFVAGLLMFVIGAEG